MRQSIRSSLSVSAVAGAGVLLFASMAFSGLAHADAPQIPPGPPSPPPPVCGGLRSDCNFFSDNTANREFGRTEGNTSGGSPGGDPDSPDGATAAAAASSSGGSGSAGAGSGSEGSGEGGLGGCFAYGTTILMADGSVKPIGRIQVGDKVMSFDSFAHLVPGTVIKTFVHYDQPVYNLDGVEVTGVHRFLTASGEWKRVEDLAPGDVLIAGDGSQVHEWTRTLLPSTNTVYNFTVATHHTYIAGGFRVHNIK